MAELNPSRVPRLPRQRQFVSGKPATPILLPYVDQGWKIPTRNWTKNRRPILRSKLVYEVARKVERYLNHMAVRSHPAEANLTFAHEYTVGDHSGRTYRRSVEDR